MGSRALTRRERDNVDFSAVGKLGRRTGVTLDQRPLDANGMEEISGMFSSPRKPSPLKNVAVMESIEEPSASWSVSVEMSGINSSGLTPTQALSATRRSARTTPIRPPRSSSPRKSGISGTARKGNNRRLDMLSPQKSLQPGEDAEDRENATPITTPTQNLPPRRFTASPDKSPLRDITTTHSFSNAKSRPSLMGIEAASSSRAPSHDVSDFVPAREATLEVEQPGTPVDARESFTPPIQNYDDNEDEDRPTTPVQHRGQSEDVASLVEDFDDEEADQTFEPENPVPRSIHSHQANSRKKRKSSIFEYDDRAGEEQVEEEGEESERIIVTPVPRKSRKVNERQSASQSPDAEPSPSVRARSSHARDKVNEQQAPEENLEADPTPTAKAQSSKSKGKSKAQQPRAVQEPSVVPAPTAKAQSSKPNKGKQPLKQKDANVKMSSRQQEQLDDIVEKIRARPGPPRSLYLLRRETPADDTVTHTRSGRVSVRPLAYWRNERCIYGGSPGGASLADGARFPLNSIKEIVRTEEIDTAVEKKKPKQKKKKNQKKEKAKGREVSRQPSATMNDTDSSSESESESDSDIDPHAEPWETNNGTLRGNVSIWDSDEQAPLEQEEEVEIAHAPAAIKTREVKTSSLEGEGRPAFGYAKLLSTKFFGAGLVDLPPGGIKRPKNSRRMHMGFYVVKGRVTVSVGPIGGEETGSTSRFSIGKGGFWQVPRGNQYSIENELGKPARVFFSQSCEPPNAGEA